MDNIVGKIFNREHVMLMSLDVPDPNFPHRISGIKCKHCGKKYYKNGVNIINHLEKEHNLIFKEIIRK